MQCSFPLISYISPLSRDLSLSICVHWGFFLCFHPSSVCSPPLQPSILFHQRRNMLSTAPTTAATSSPHLCCAVSNAIVLTPTACVYVGESCCVRVIATPLLSPFLLCLPAGQRCPMHRRWAVTAYLSCLTHWLAKNRLISTVCNWYTQSHTRMDIHTLPVQIKCTYIQALTRRLSDILYWSCSHFVQMFNIYLSMYPNIK